MNLSPAAVTFTMCEATFSNPTAGSCSHCGPFQPSEQVQVWLPPSALQTSARAEISICTRDIHTCMLSAGTDKTRANEGEKFWQREAEEGAMHRVEKVLHKRKIKAAGDKAEQKKGGEGGGSGEKGSCRDIAVQSNTCRCRGCRRGSRRSQSGART